MKVAWTRLALEDMNNAYEFVAQQNPYAATNIINRIEAGVNALRIHPNLGRPGRVQGTRELVVAGTPFIIPYRIRRGRVEILALIHASRRWPETF